MKVALIAYYWYIELFVIAEATGQFEKKLQHDAHEALLFLINSCQYL